jgi:hypothetical protein
MCRIVIKTRRRDTFATATDLVIRAGIAFRSTAFFVALVLFGRIETIGTTLAFTFIARADPVCAGAGISTTRAILVAGLAWKGAARQANFVGSISDMNYVALAPTSYAVRGRLTAAIVVIRAKLSQCSADKSLDLPADSLLAPKADAAVTIFTTFKPFTGAGRVGNLTVSCFINESAWAIANPLKAAVSVAAGFGYFARRAGIQTRLAGTWRTISSRVKDSAGTITDSLEAGVSVATIGRFVAGAPGCDTRFAWSTIAGLIKQSRRAGTNRFETDVAVTAYVTLNALRTDSQTFAGRVTGAVLSENAARAITDSLETGEPVAAFIGFTAGCGLGNAGRQNRRSGS